MHYGGREKGVNGENEIGAQRPTSSSRAEHTRPLSRGQKGQRAQGRMAGRSDKTPSPAPGVVETKVVDGLDGVAMAGKEMQKEKEEANEREKEKEKEKPNSFSAPNSRNPSSMKLGVTRQRSFPLLNFSFDVDKIMEAFSQA